MQNSSGQCRAKGARRITQPVKASLVDCKTNCFTLVVGRRQPLSNLLGLSIRIFIGTTKNESRYHLDHLVP